MRAWPGRMPPGCKHDLIPVLIGDQGTGKSTFCHFLLPSDRRVGRGGWFSDNVDLSESQQKQVEAVGPSFVIEFSELQGLGKAQLDRLKSYITRPSEQYRPPYARQAVSIDRRWIGIATKNPGEDGALPRDSSGNRRFVAVEVPEESTPARVRECLDACRDQLWAEAKHAFKAGEQWWFPLDIEKEQKRMNRKWTRVNEAMGPKLAELAEGLKTDEGLRLAEIMTRIGLVENEAAAMGNVRLQREIASELRLAGWDKGKRMVGG